MVGLREPVCTTGHSIPHRPGSCTVATASYPCPPESRTHTRGNGMSTATRNTKADEDGGRDVFTPHRSQENGMQMWAAQCRGKEENGGQSKFLNPPGEGRHHTKRISGEFWKEIFGKLGELGTHDTYPIGSHIRYVLQLPNHGAHRMPGLCCWLGVPILRAGRVRASWSPVYLPRPLENIGAIPHKKAKNARSSRAGLFILSTAVSLGLEPPGP